MAVEFSEESTAVKIDGVWVCLGSNYYGIGFTKQEAYEDYREKTDNPDAYRPHQCKFIFGTHAG